MDLMVFFVACEVCIQGPNIKEFRSTLEPTGAYEDQFYLQLAI